MDPPWRSSIGFNGIIETTSMPLWLVWNWKTRRCAADKKAIRSAGLFTFSWSSVRKTSQKSGCSSNISWKTTLVPRGSTIVGWVIDSDSHQRGKGSDQDALPNQINRILKEENLLETVVPKESSFIGHDLWMFSTTLWCGWIRSNHRKEGLNSANS